VVGPELASQLFQLIFSRAKFVFQFDLTLRQIMNDDGQVKPGTCLPSGRRPKRSHSQRYLTSIIDKPETAIIRPEQDHPHPVAPEVGILDYFEVMLIEKEIELVSDLLQTCRRCHKMQAGHATYQELSIKGPEN